MSNYDALKYKAFNECTPRNTGLFDTARAAYRLLTTGNGAWDVVKSAYRGTSALLRGHVVTVNLNEIDSASMGMASGPHYVFVTPEQELCASRLLRGMQQSPAPLSVPAP